ncbi:ParB/RepB/Spo0J family partition protein [Canibacter sp. lx-72]|uniref:ParB/RepB/Spo0J family partition protein n=1 Tax=Canibacter zhuwentaonis TaxID=2837491 RepID=UPI001BDDC7CA|nr:ParB/RepB/Spo0J family partition protein [Canibacter zhuwentaonis]MBT1018113.1 ParB/RepB/Spo0J family partition protein [Canibacter zhuwentaonis]
MAKKRKGLGRGISALIPQASNQANRPVDVFFPTGNKQKDSEQGAKTPESAPETVFTGTFSSGIENNANASQIGAQEPSFSGDEQKNMGVAAVVAAAAKNYAKSVQANSEQTLQQVPGAYLMELPVAEICVNRVNPRTNFDEDALAELTHSVKEFGVLQPIVVRKLSDTEFNTALGVKYEIIMGERRFRASKGAGLDLIPAIVRETDDENMLRDALLENLHRVDLNPLEEASAYQQLMSDFGITQEELSQKIGRSRSQISNTVRLLRLPETVQELLVSGDLSSGHARAILGLQEQSAMQELAQKTIAQNLTVRQVEELVAGSYKKPRHKRRLGSKTIKLDAVSKRLSSRFETKVQIKLGVKKGQVIIDFNNIAELNRVLSELGDEGYSL